MKKYQNIFKMLIIFLLVIGFLFLIAQIPFIKDIIDPKNYPAIKSYIMSFGIFSYAIAFLIQALQIITFVFPAPVVWIPISMVFGPLIGTLLCTLSIFLTNLIIFVLIRKTNFNTEKLLKNKKENTSEKAFFVMFLFAFSGLPNLFVTALYAKTKISMKKYLTLTTLAIIPAILSTTVLTNFLIQGKYILFILGIILIILLLFLVNKLEKRL